ncbi:MAG: glycosyltransferase family protein [Gammaproteobacteria bacterium]
MSSRTRRGPSTQVCLFDFPPTRGFHGYDLHTFDPGAYIGRREGVSAAEWVRHGWSGRRKFEKLYSAAGIDHLYRSRDPAYMRMVTDFVERFRDFDLIILFNYNPIHPEILYHELKRPIKVLGLVDDPQASYARSVPYLWAFDGACYISPSFDERHLFPEVLHEWGVTRHRWWPLRPEPEPVLRADAAFFENRDIDLIYFGNAYGSKLDRLRVLKRKYGWRFHVYGRWPMAGYYGWLRPVFGKPVFPYRVVPVNMDARQALYCRARIGINMHLSDVPRETGNMRMYEVPAHGAMLLCDKAGRDAHARIFSPGEEAVFYDSMGDAVDKIEYYLEHQEERIRIARNGFERVRRDYAWAPNLQGLLDWAMGLRGPSETVADAAPSPDLERGGR